MTTSVSPTEGDALSVESLSVSLHLRHELVRAVNSVSYRVKHGETFALVGESGSGKTVSARAVMGLLSHPFATVSGRVSIEGIDVFSLSPRARRRRLGGRMAMIFQDPLSALNPSYTVGFQIAEMFRVHRGFSRAKARQAAAQALEEVNIAAASRRLDDYPVQFSGGMRQRVMIAMALALDPVLLIADEPTTALDVTVQAQIMELLDERATSHGTALLLITHDLGIVAERADDLAVMYAGEIVEMGPAGDLLRSPTHPYTAGLLECLPHGNARSGRLTTIPGAPPDLAQEIVGCPFAPRCPAGTEICTTVKPLLRRGPHGRLFACHHPLEVHEPASST